MLHPVLIEKLNASVAARVVPPGTPRDARLPPVPRKAHAVIGMRRAGKTTFLHQLQEQRRQGLPPERAVLISFEDDRLAGLSSDHLSLLLEEYYRRYPGLRQRDVVHWFFDEIQGVSGWERFVRRVLDSERVEIVLSGSSARMLSREVHTSLRGRGMETVIRPFSFREYLRHRGEEPDEPCRRWTNALRSLIEKRFGEFLVEGGFPEVQGLAPALRVELLQGYVDTVLFRDIVERHGITQVAALRWITRHCLRNAAGAVSVHRLHRDLRSQGHAVGKDAVHAMLGHLVDAFLLSTVSLSTESERQRNSNPRKVYPVDPGLIRAFDHSGRANVGHALETAVLHELERRKAEVGYVRTDDAAEVDFLAGPLDGPAELIQVCADPSAEATREREIRALARARTTRATRRLLVLTQEQAVAVRVPGVVVQPAYEWLLESAVAEGGVQEPREPSIKQ
jgi:hypothetical protein